jgi:hypothetical protein
VQGLESGMGGSLVLRGPRFLFLDHGLHLHQLTDEPLSVNGAFLLVTLGSKQALSFRFAEKKPGLLLWDHYSSLRVSSPRQSDILYLAKFPNDLPPRCHVF